MSRPADRNLVGIALNRARPRVRRYARANSARARHRSSFPVPATFEDQAMIASARTLLRTVLLALFTCAAHAADVPSAAPAPANDALAPARAQIAAKNWTGAIDELKRINATASADWNNLMGYVHRKSKTPDYAAAEKFYDEALRIEPKHRGALEYSGELYLIKGDLAKAEQRLAALDKACFLPCEEYTDLKNAVARFKAAGNKYVAGP
jgi:tetratricopeptide (TPR) repeat protein